MTDDSDRTPGLDDGGGVDPGDTPPADDQTSLQSQSERDTHSRVPSGPSSPRTSANLLLILAVVVAVLVVIGAITAVVLVRS